MKKRIFGLLLCFFVMMAMVPVLAIADGEMVTVSFDMKGHGTGAPVDQTIPKGTPAVEPVEPVPLAEEKFYFGYWTYIRNYFVTRWDFSNNVNEDMTLSALWFPWETRALQLALDGQPYSGVTALAKDTTAGTTHILTEGDPGLYSVQLPEGNYDMMVNDELILPNQTVGRKGSSSKYFFYYYSMNFNSNGQIFATASAPGTQVVRSANCPSIPSLPEAANANYAFTGWTKGPGADSGVFDFSRTMSSTRTAYAQWVQVNSGEYPVAVYGAEHEGSSVATSSSDYQVTLKPPATYEYPCTIEKIQIGGQKISQGQYSFNGDTGLLTIDKAAITGPIEIFASMVLSPYVMTYVANNGTGAVGFGFVSRTTNMHYMWTCTFTGPEGQTFFKGWSLNQDGSGKLYQPGTSYYTTADTTFYAVWWSGVNSVSMTVPLGTGIRGQRTYNGVSAVVEGAPHVSQDVTWSVTGATSQDTHVSPEGHFGVGLDETADEITIRATSVVDPTHYDELVVPIKSFVIVKNGSSGNSNIFKNGERVTITANEAPQDMVFDKWFVTRGNVTLDDAFTTPTAFTMARETVEVEATYKSALPGIEGPTAMMLTEGYTDPVSTEAYQLTGTPLPDVAIDDNLGGRIVWNDTDQTMTVAPGLNQGNYTVTLTASNGLSTDATLTFHLTVQGPPSIKGDTALTLVEGYEETKTSAYAITGLPAPDITFHASDPKITWDNQTGEIHIASGLGQGDYTARLAASNGLDPDAALTFHLTVQGPPSIKGDTALTLVEGYEETKTSAYAITGLPAPEISFHASDPKITWGNQTGEIHIASGLSQGDYTARLTASNGLEPDAALTFHLTVQGPPSIKGDTALTLVEGYEETKTSTYAIAGLPAPEISFHASDPKISWNSQTGEIHIASGLRQGKYAATLTAANGQGPDATLTFSLNVEPAGSGVPQVPSGPGNPTDPTVPTEPAGPDGTTEPTGPGDPTDPTGPTEPAAPDDTTEPAGPDRVEETSTTSSPSKESAEADPPHKGGGYTALVIAGILLPVFGAGYIAIRHYGRKKR